jgi:glycosyltransferase involved in cell wall biosynthesis
MRVAHLLRKYDPSEWGGTESVMLQLATELARRGVESIVYAPRISPGGAVPGPLEAAGCTVRRFRACVPIWGISSERRRQMVAVGGNMVSFGLAGALWGEKDVDVIHSHALGRLGAIGRLVARARRIPFVVSIHGGAYDIPAELRQELRRPAAGGWDWGRSLGIILRARHLLDQADAIITLNEREASLVRERHPGRRVLVEPHGVPTALFADECGPAALAAFPELRGRPVLLVLGRIDPTKNQGWVIAEAKELARRHPGVLIVFAGAFTDREYANALQARIADAGLQGLVLMVGSLPFGDPRLIGLLQEARAVILPSVSETFGIVILEAWSAGTPVIASRTSGATALVEEGVNGFLFDLERPATFHVAVDRVLAQPDQAAKWGAAGRAKVVAEFDSSVSADRMRGLYVDLIEAKDALRHSKGR